MRARMRDIAMGASWSWGLMLLVHVMTMMLSASYSMSSQSAGTAAAAAMRVAELEQLRKDFYNGTCPQAEEIIRRSVTRAVRLDPTAPAALLRLAFHDCQVGVNYLTHHKLSIPTVCCPKSIALHFLITHVLNFVSSLTGTTPPSPSLVQLIHS